MLQYLFSPTKQFTYDSGKLLDAGQIYVYIQDTTDLATLYDDNGDYTSNPIILDVNGRASVKADDTYEYRLEVYDCFGVLQFTCTAFYGGEGGGGTFIVRHDDTLSGNGTSQSLLGVVNIPLAVDETMTAYEAEVSGENALVLGVNGDWFGKTFSSYYNNKVDLSSFNELSGIVNDKADATALNNYYTKDETNNLFQPQSAMGDYYLKTQTSSDVELANAFANIPGGSGSDIWISGEKIIAPDTIDLFPGTTAQSLSSFTVSGNKNHCIAVKGGIYRVPDINQWVSAISSTNYFTTQNEFYSSASMLSGAINYVSSNAGGSYNGISPIYVNNTTNEISADSFTLTIGSGLALENDTLYVSANGVVFPIVSDPYTADCNGSSFKISTTTSTLTLSENGATYASYPSTNIDATWTQILAKAKEPQYIPTVSSYIFVVNSEVDIQYSAVDKVNEISFIAARWGSYENYSANFLDGDTNKGILVIPSGKVMTATKSWDWEENGYKWCKKLQDGTLMPM